MQTKTDFWLWIPSHLPCRQWLTRDKSNFRSNCPENMPISSMILRWATHSISQRIVMWSDPMPNMALCSLANRLSTVKVQVSHSAQSEKKSCTSAKTQSKSQIHHSSPSLSQCLQRQRLRHPAATKVKFKVQIICPTCSHLINSYREYLMNLLRTLRECWCRKRCLATCTTSQIDLQLSRHTLRPLETATTKTLNSKTQSRLWMTSAYSGSILKRGDRSANLSPKNKVSLLILKVIYFLCRAHLHLTFE